MYEVKKWFYASKVERQQLETCLRCVQSLCSYSGSGCKMGRGETAWSKHHIRTVCQAPKNKTMCPCCNTIDASQGGKKRLQNYRAEKQGTHRSGEGREGGGWAAVGPWI